MKGVPGEESCVRKSNCVFPIDRWSVGFVLTVASAGLGIGVGVAPAAEAFEELEAVRLACVALRPRREVEGAATRRVLLRSIVRASILAPLPVIAG